MAKRPPAIIAGTWYGLESATDYRDALRAQGKVAWITYRRGKWTVLYRDPVSAAVSAER